MIENGWFIVMGCELMIESEMVVVEVFVVGVVIFLLVECDVIFICVSYDDDVFVFMVGEDVDFLMMILDGVYFVDFC